MSTSGCKRAQHRGPGSPAGTCSRMPLRHGPPGGAGRQGQPNAPAQACSSPYSRFAPARSPPVKPVPPSTRAPSTDEPARRRSTPSAHCRTPHQPVWRSRDTTGPPPAKPPPHAKPPGRRPTDQTGRAATKPCSAATLSQRESRWAPALVAELVPGTLRTGDGQVVIDASLRACVDQCGNRAPSGQYPSPERPRRAESSTVSRGCGR